MQTTTLQGTAQNLAVNHPEGVARNHVDLYLQYLRGLRRDPSTIRRHRFGLLQFREFLDRCRIGDLRAVRGADLSDYRSELMGSGLSSHAVRSRLRVVRSFYAFLERNGAVLLDPASDLLLPKLETRVSRVVLTSEEMRRLRLAPDTSTLVGLRDRAMFELLYSSAIRLAELCRLSLNDVDLAGGLVRVNGGKGGKDRLVPLGRGARQWLRAYMEKARGTLAAMHVKERCLFLGERKSRPLHPRWVRQIVRRHAMAAGIRKAVSPHVFRHTCATHMLAGGADIAQVQRLLGHARLCTTQIYTRVAIAEVKATHRRTHPREQNERWG
jgi:integrase/recombinase XerD